MALRFLSYQNLPDEELMPFIADGSAAAFDELYRRYAQKMFSYFFRMLWKNRELAEDQTQELFLKMIQHAGNFDQSRVVSTWLYSIAHNMCKNEYRKEEVKAKYLVMKKQTDVISEVKNIDLRKFKEAVNHCTNELEEEKRSLFILRFQEQLTIPDISRILNLPEGTVKSRLFYLLKELKEKLKHFETIHIS
jgi:RNA polymerase sigma-70 factor, ECF subfamily